MKNQIIPANGTFYLRSAQDLIYERNVTELTGGKINFGYPSNNFPEVKEPYIAFESKESTLGGIVSVADVIALRKHLPGL